MTVPILYKYHSFDEHLFELIKTNSFYVASLEELNDVFDCKFKFTDEWFEKGFRNKMPDMFSIGKGRALIKQAISDERFLDDFFQREPIKSISRSGVCSFTSTDHENELLWAYYTKYNGVCMKFDFTNDENLKHDLHKVEYDDEIPQVSHENDMMKAGRTKKKLFQFEKEFRILYMAGKDKLTFNKSSLKSIYYGSRVKQSEIEELQKIVKEKKYEIESFKMDVKPYKNHFTFKPI